ncbi:MAG: Rrf2 family transcriptional regulator [Paracoccaceae bacterium]
MRLTIRTNIAMRALMYCAVNRDRTVRKSDIAAACNASENHMAQVINALAHFGWLQTTRGRNGGVALHRPPEEIAVGAVFRKLESDVPFAECFSANDNTCPIACACRLRGTISDALGAFYGVLDKVTLADLVTDNAGLQKVLELR